MDPTNRLLPKQYNGKHFVLHTCKEHHSDAFKTYFYIFWFSVFYHRRSSFSSFSQLSSTKTTILKQIRIDSVLFLYSHYFSPFHSFLISSQTQHQSHSSCPHVKTTAIEQQKRERSGSLLPVLRLTELSVHVFLEQT